jgi:hypothetical protein
MAKDCSWHPSIGISIVIWILESRIYRTHYKSLEVKYEESTQCQEAVLHGSN